MISKSRTKWYLIECLSAMHLYHPHRDDNDDKRQEWEGKLEHTCYNCGRQFVKNKSSFLHLKKRMHRCPCCHTEFGHDSSVDGRLKDSDNRSGRSGRKNRFRLSAPFLIRSILAIAPLHKRKDQSAGFEDTTRTTVHFSTDHTVDGAQGDGDDLVRRQKEKSNDDDIVSNSSCLADKDPCPFSFTYDDETIEHYQIHEPNDSETLDVETYQLEWLLCDV